MSNYAGLVRSLAPQLGLGDWTIRVHTVDDPRKSTAPERGSATVSPEYMEADLYFNAAVIDDAAAFVKHELLHLHTASLANFAAELCTTEAERYMVDWLEDVLITHLERLL